MKRALVAGSLIATLVSAAVTAAEVSYPSGYRDWHHVKSMVIDKGHPLFDAFGGMHHLYANSKAMEGYRNGHFPDGSVIVFDLLDVKVEGGATTEGARKIVGVMEKNASRFPDTGGWGFEGFAGGDKSKRAVRESAVTACYSCHTAQKSHDFVFSQTRE